MAEYVRGFVLADVADTHARFQKAILDAEALVTLEKRAGKDIGGRKLLETLNAAYDTFNVNLRETAKLAAVNATKGMVERLESQRHRPESGATPPLRDLVAAEPLSVGKYQTGAVGIANVVMLNRAINPHSRGYGPYWRAIEYGTGQGEVPSQVGRILYGTFESGGGGDATPPMAEYAGGGGPHPVFISAKGASNPASGLGTIGHEVQAKHFIKFGADEARIKWRADIDQLQSRAIDELKAIKLGRP